MKEEQNAERRIEMKLYYERNPLILFLHFLLMLLIRVQTTQNTMNIYLQVEKNKQITKNSDVNKTIIIAIIFVHIVQLSLFPLCEVIK